MMLRLMTPLLLAAVLSSPVMADADEDQGGGNTVPPREPAANLAAKTSGMFISPNISLYEAHWQGMDVMLLDAELRQKLKYPRGLQGVIINEVTLNASLSGMLGGDIIIAVDGNQVTNLQEFQKQTRTVKNRNHAPVTVLRKSSHKNGDRYTMNRMIFILRARDELGFAQVESAPMIVPGDPRPPPDRGPCTDCHTVGDGRFTMPDPDLINLPPPKIPQDVMLMGVPPHKDRGPCEACHQPL